MTVVTYTEQAIHNTDHSNVVVHNDRAYDFYTKESLSHFDLCKKYLGLSFPQTAYLLDYFYSKVKKQDVKDSIEKTFSTSAAIWIAKTETPLPIDLNYIIEENRFTSVDSDIRHKAYQVAFTDFKLDKKQKIKTYSKGMTMKLAISAALAHHPKLLILDEATSGLDPVMREEILDVFLGFVQDEKHSILLSSHITSDLEKVADYITFIHEGEIILSARKDDLIYRYAVLRCKSEQFSKLDKADIVAYRKRDYQIDVAYRRAVAELPDIQRRRFVLYYEHGLTYWAIGEMEGSTATSIKSSVDIAKTKIMKKLEA